MTDNRHMTAAWDVWARYYDLIVGDRAPLIAFYQSLISPRTRSFLELACGTGTITSAVADRIFQNSEASADSRIVGVDESNAMLRIARARDTRIQWVQGDMRRPPVKTDFDVVVCCFNTVQGLLTVDELSRFFGSVARLLRPSGVFAFDIYQPDLEYLAMPRTDRVYRSVTDASGQCFDLREDYQYDPVSRILTMNQRLVQHGGNSENAVARVEYQYAQYFAEDLARLLTASGFFVRHCYGDFDKSHLTPASKKQVFVCERC